VISSHLGFGHNPATIWVVADRLAQPEDGWAPFRPPAALRPLFPRAARLGSTSAAAPAPRTAA
jgi:hypothetical protein